MEKIHEGGIEKIVIATWAFACVTLLSFSWSERRGVSLGIESAEARADRPSSPVRVAGVARRQPRRSASGHRLLAAVVAATTSPRNYDDYDCYDFLTQVSAILLAIITALILVATASVVATPQVSMHGRRCFLAIMAAGSADRILAAGRSHYVCARTNIT